MTEHTDSDAWAKACAEDLAAEQARRRAQYGTGQGTAGEELRRLFDTVADKLTTALGGPAAKVAGAAAAGAATSAAQEMARQFLATAKAASEAVVERNPELFDHLTAARDELIAAYRAAVERDEARWTKDGPDGGPEHIDLDRDTDGNPT
ncbi:hypothetical protein SRB5_54770 [Streptomyces sp. RB5]|uniref:Uncharacterized protein n=1 Tax=Streptomyces smaragdinus TaxID=2585196 RepID=A0A7K0CP88_9ACTN|nr:DUF5304 family protein [Streptomyces smaragdinus]MQY15298.1 hypothetical protein [Streptomyces smaragdinus]